MLDTLGTVGALGVLLLVAGVGVIAYVDLLIAAGIAFIVAGLGLIVYGVASNLMAKLGMGAGGMF